MQQREGVLRDQKKSGGPVLVREQLPRRQQLIATI